MKCQTQVARRYPHETDHLLSHHDNSLYRESPVTVIKQILQARPQKINDQYIMQTLLSEIVNIRDARWPIVSTRYLAEALTEN